MVVSYLFCFCSLSLSENPSLPPSLNTVIGLDRLSFKSSLKFILDYYYVKSLPDSKPVVSALKDIARVNGMSDDDASSRFSAASLENVGTLQELRLLPPTDFDTFVKKQTCVVGEFLNILRNN